MLDTPTIRDIAERLGLGKSTVQRVLAGTGSVSAKTRKSIIDTADKLGYRPNPLFSILGSQKRRRTLKPMKVAYVYRQSVRAGIDYFSAAAARGKVRFSSTIFRYQIPPNPLSGWKLVEWHPQFIHGRHL